MALLGSSGGSSSSSSSITRPAYVQDFIDQIYNDAENLDPISWANKQYAGFNQWEQDALNKMSNSTQLDNFTQGLQNMATTGKGYMQQALTGLTNMYQQGPITASDITNEASQLYNQEAVQNAQVAANNRIYSQGGAGMAQNAEQANMANQGTYTSGAANQQSSALSNMISNIGTADSGIANQAWNQALQEGAGILTGQRSMQQGALSGLMKMGNQELNAAFKAAGAGQNAINREWKAGLLEQENAQNQANMNYFNQKGGQETPWLYANEMMKLASSINSAEGQNRSSSTKTKRSGGLF